MYLEKHCRPTSLSIVGLGLDDVQGPIIQSEPPFFRVVLWMDDAYRSSVSVIIPDHFPLGINKVFIYLS
jgi:hypothetical protein